MIRFVLCLSLSLYQFALFQCQNDQFDVEWDQKLENIDKAFKCGIENRYKQGSKARIINGKVATNIRYPWMAEIVRFVFYPKDSGMSGIDTYGGTGSIISHKAILTVAHNLCNRLIDKHYNTWSGCQKDFQELPSEGQTPSRIFRNQNRLFNQIHYSIGTMNSFNEETKSKLTKDQLASFRKDINAFVYKYEPDWWNEASKTDPVEHLKRTLEFWKNGDIGLIVVESKLGLDLKLNKAVPICLPSQKTISENQKQNGELKVTAVGRGLVYDEFKDRKGNKKQSCMTNEGLVKHKNIENFQIQEIFLQCKHDINKDDKCLAMKDACMGEGDNVCKGYKHQLLSTNVKIDFFDHSKPPLRRMRISIPKNDDCEKLLPKVNKAISKLDKGRQRIFHKDDGLGPSRILVFDKDEQDSESFEDMYYKWRSLFEQDPSVSYCYNLKRLAQWGLCETLGDSNSYKIGYNFGFCSSSCKLKGSGPFKNGEKEIQYLEFKANYHETWDDKLDDYESSKYF